ncbi:MULTISPECIES: response regulator transcription factor [Malaciobacter]|uniref:DNA-binding response regulator n=1 Tax=Malaciobacter canalis TaxID=1912871 RepID=A0ABX4LN09_9BACT|nr:MULTISPECIES: response regulator transcription factor [Malaciobacter]PHO08920.1 DNA-binding response regulator [Malaciobacter canalis]QEE32878.1 two-component system response regulator [Malaciobacter canalis]SKB60996.1 DNA-binding response regulator, OmpR family, contains REC and winged-helix (wHTH) domain [Malaciobacter marinus]
MPKNVLKEFKVLLVEDESNIAKLLKDAIGDYFFSFTLAKNGQEGLEKMKTIKPDIIITDIMMPKLDGLAMTEKIKQIDESIPVIVLSAFSEKEKLLNAIDIGITKYFIKPFDPDEVLEYLVSLAIKLDKKRVFKLSEDLYFDRNKNNLFDKNDKIINLTKREKDFLYLLIKNHPNSVSVEKIKKTLWEKEEATDERLRTFIKRIRAKTSKTLIKNISGQGYLISPDNI